MLLYHLGFTKHGVHLEVKVRGNSYPTILCCKKKNQHYVDMPMLFTAILMVVKNDSFQIKKCDVFHIFAQNIHCGYTLEQPRVEAVLPTLRLF